MEVVGEWAGLAAHAAKQKWEQTARAYTVLSHRLGLDAPIVLSRSSFYPLLFLSIQAVVLAIVSTTKAGLHSTAGLIQLGVTLACVFLLFIQMEGLEIASRNYRSISNMSGAYDQQLDGPSPLSSASNNNSGYSERDDENMLPN
jgi:hypothetical protein